MDLYFFCGKARWAMWISAHFVISNRAHFPHPLHLGIVHFFLGWKILEREDREAA